jgi:hypothetical protein
MDVKLRPVMFERRPLLVQAAVYAAGFGGVRFICGACPEVVSQNGVLGALTAITYRCRSCGTVSELAHASPADVWPRIAARRLRPVRWSHPADRRLAS